MKFLGEHRIQQDIRVEPYATTTLGKVNDPGTDTDKFLVYGTNGLVGYRTGAEVLADIGGMASSVNFLAFDGSTANGVCTYKDADEISVESTLTYDSETLILGADDDGHAIIKRLAHSNDAGGQLHLFAGSATAGQTNKAGGNLRLSGGQGTGSGVGGDVKVYTAAAGGSGTNLNIYSNTWSFNDDGTLDAPGNISITGDIVTSDDAIIGDDIQVGPDDVSSSNITRQAHSDGDGGDLNIISGNATDGQTDKAGGDLFLFGGKSTGSAAGGNVTISTYETGSSGTTLASTAKSWKFSAGNSSTLSSPKQCLGIKENVNFVNETFETVLSDGDHTGSKVLIYGADETLTDGQIYFLHTNASWDLAQANDVATGASQLLGVGNGRTVSVGVILEGFIRVPDTEIIGTPVIGAPVYISETTAGHFDFDRPANNNEFVRVVGYCVDTYDDSGVDALIYFKPDNTWVKVTA